MLGAFVVDELECVFSRHAEDFDRRMSLRGLISDR